MIVSNSAVSNYICLHDKVYSFFGGNNYLGLADNPLLKRAAINSIEKYGLNFAAARQTTGTSEIHTELEKLLATFKNKEDAVVFGSGYMGNRILLTALGGNYSSVFMDEFSHSSIKEGIPSDISEILVYNHCDPDHLEGLLKANNKGKPLIITDGVFSLTGEIAPLDKIHALSEKYGAIIVVDDAHSTGVLGKNGRGTPEHFNLESATNIYQTETMSKAGGVYGGFIAGDRELTGKIREKSSTYLASTSLPPPLVSASAASVTIIMQHTELRTSLHRNLKMIIDGVRKLGYLTFSRETPIIPLCFKLKETAEELSEFLKEHGIIVPFIIYPVNTGMYILRITVSSVHTLEQIGELLAVLGIWINDNGSRNDQICC
jgi:7-keto-8-aminopelargonate synthetase-like enzyme